MSRCLLPLIIFAFSFALAPSILLSVAGDDYLLAMSSIDIASIPSMQRLLVEAVARFDAG